MKKNLILLALSVLGVAFAKSPTKTEKAEKLASQMIMRIADIEVYQEYLDEYLAAAKNVGAVSVSKEPGVIAIFPTVLKSDPCKFRIVEIYASQEAYQHHITTEHFKAYKERTLKMVKSLDLIDVLPLNAEGMPDIFKKMKL